MLTRHAAIILGALAAAVVIPLAAAREGPTASGQILPPGPPATPIPTSPCTGCGPTGAGPNVTFRAWAYPLHFCPPGTSFANSTFVEGSALYAIVYGLGSNSTDTSATFFGEINGTVRQLETLSPGQRAISLPAVVVPPGVTFNLTLWATTDGTQTGPRVIFGNGTDTRPATLTCDCAPVPTQQSTPPGDATSIVTTVTGVTTPVNTVGPGAIPPSR